MKVITLRLTDDEYKAIADRAKEEYRPISNFITAHIMKEIEYVDAVEEEEIKMNKTLQKRLNRGVKEAKQRKGRMIG
jgi:uncharacterized protein (DUF1778 family)